MGGGNGVFRSGPISVPLVPGTFYWIGAFWDQPVTYFFSNTMPGPPLFFDYGFTTMEYHARQGAFPAPPPGPLSFIGPGATTVAPYWQCYTLEP